MAGVGFTGQVMLVRSWVMANTNLAISHRTLPEKRLFRCAGKRTSWTEGEESIDIKGASVFMTAIAKLNEFLSLTPDRHLIARA
jgi:hypothetical protein